MSTTNQNDQHIHPGHATELLQQLQLLLSVGNDGLCDVVLIAGKNGQRVPAHRVILAANSPYFRTMFTVKMRESTAAEVTEEDVDGDILLPLIQFCYTGEIEISADTVDELARTAHRLQLDTVVSACSAFMERHLDASNCLGVAALAELLSLNDLKQMAEKYTCKHFVQVSRQEEFLQLSIDQLKCLIGSDELRVPTEEAVFQSVISWVHYEKDVEGKRSEHISALLGFVRLSLLPPLFLTKHVWTLCHEHECMPLLRDAFEEANMPIGSRRIKARKPVQSDVLAVWSDGSKPLNISLYSSVKDEWKLLDKTFRLRTWFAAAFFNDELIVAGGNVDGIKSNTVESLNLDTMTLSKLPAMTQKRSSFGMAVIDGLLYASGGYDEFMEVVNRVERFDPNDCKWSDVAPMSVGRCSYTLTVLDSRLFAVGGIGCNKTILNSTECYDPQTDKWTMLANLNISRRNSSIASGNGFLYTVGGYAVNQQQLNSIERYDPQANKWTEICSLISPLSQISCVFLNDSLLILGTHDEKTLFQDYNILTETWTQRAMLLDRGVFYLHAFLK